MIHQNEDSMTSCDSIPDGLPILNPAAFNEAESDATFDKPLPAIRDVAMASTDSNSKSEKRTLNRTLTEDVTYKVTEPKDLVEYEWPLKSGEKWMIQEQISELMQITAFKRRYPEMTMRQVRKEEKEYLINEHKVNTLLAELHMQHMTAIRAVEVHNLLYKEKPKLHAEYQRIASDRVKEKMAEQQREMDILKKDPKALEALRQKTIASASQWNHQLVETRKCERKTYWDLQTGVIQSEVGAGMVTPGAPKPSSFPAALIPGQYHDYYKQYTPDELNRLPLGSILDGDHFFPLPREQSPPPITVQGNELKSPVADALSPTPQRDIKPVVKTDMPTPKQNQLKKTKCTHCLLSPKPDLTMLRCAACLVTMHAECVDMDEVMTQRVLEYAWYCLECKRCTMCLKQDNEDDLIICDRCDRGYHTYCVGVDKLPTGTWLCTEYCAAVKAEAAVETTASGRPRRRTRKSIL